MQLKSCLLAIPLLLLTFMTTAGANGNRWVDSVSLTLGTDEDSLDADVYRLGLQNRWGRTWFNGGAWNVGGYWDAEFAYLEADAGQGENNNLYDISLTPVFRLQRDTALSSGVDRINCIVQDMKDRFDKQYGLNGQAPGLACRGDLNIDIPFYKKIGLEESHNCV